MGARGRKKNYADLENITFHEVYCDKYRGHSLLVAPYSSELCLEMCCVSIGKTNQLMLYGITGSTRTLPVGKMQCSCILKRLLDTVITVL
jgi:hypothetical protein